MTCVVIGAGPAGLCAAWELRRLGREAIVVERDHAIGGLSRTVVHEGYRFDIGGHRFFTKLPEVQALWEEILGDDFLVRQRMSRILYRGRYFHYPLRPLNALAQLGPIETVRVVASYLVAQIGPRHAERSFEDWVTRRFGRRLFEIFFRTYTEKVWGMPCDQIAADWAAQRIRNVDLSTIVRNAFLGAGSGPVATTLIDRFHYPRLGPGMMWERLAQRLAERGVPTLLGTAAVRLHHEAGRVVAVDLHGADGPRRLDAEHVISSLPLRTLIRQLDPLPPPEVVAAADGLRHRAFISVGLTVDEPALFPDNWIYVHEPGVRVGRIQNFGNWSPEMVPAPDRASLGFEYFVDQGDDLWRSTDEDLIAMAGRECEQLGLARRSRIGGGVVVRMPHAYPVYDPGYRERVERIRRWLGGIENLQTVGRNGQHRYNNQDHSMVTGLLAARNVAGTSHDVWAVNVDPDHHEIDTGRSGPALATGDADDLVRQAFARYDAVALGTAAAVVASVGLLLVTAISLLTQSPLLPKLSLLDNYLFGFAPSWRGAVVAAVEGAVGGFAFGHTLAVAINLFVRFSEAALRRQLELNRGMDEAAEG